MPELFRYLAVWLAAWFLSPCSTAQVSHSPHVPAGYTMVWNDEFDGAALDLGKWVYRTDCKHWSCQLPSNVSVSGGDLRLRMAKRTVRPGFAYTGAGVISKRSFRYGYYEFRVRMFAPTGWHQSLWMMAHDGSGSTRTAKTYYEIDVCEHDSVDSSRVSTGSISWNQRGSSPRRYVKGLPDLSAGYHVFGCEWSPDGIVHTLDGKVLIDSGTSASTQELNGVHIWLTTIASWLGGTRRVDDASLPGDMRVDYVRYYVRETGNLALNKPVLADSWYGFDDPSEAVDGNNRSRNSRWVSSGSTTVPHWLEVDLGGLRGIDEVRFWTGVTNYSDPISSYRIQRWDRGRWVDIVRRTNNTSAAVVERFTPVVTDRVRLFVPPGKGFVRVFELEVYGEGAVGTNVARGRKVTASSVNGIYLPAGAVDGNRIDNASRWLSKDQGGADWRANPQWLEVDLGRPTWISQFAFWTGWNDYCRAPRDFRFQQHNGSGWVDVVVVQGNILPHVRRSFAPVVTDRVRLLATRGDDGYFRVFELEVFGAPTVSAGVRNYGCRVVPGSLSVRGSPKLGQTLQVAIDNPSTSTQARGPTVLLLATRAASADIAARPCGLVVPGWGMAPHVHGELLVDPGSVLGSTTGPVWSAGRPSLHALRVPVAPALLGQRAFLQGAILESAPAPRPALTQGMRLTIGR